jgi:hypothetical protein
MRRRICKVCRKVRSKAERFRPNISQHATVLDAIKAKPDGGREARPALTASARAGFSALRSGRKKACCAVEQKILWGDGRLSLGQGFEVR